jgi:hypothetical protein
MQDIFEKFTGDAMPYTYDTLLSSQDLYGGNVIRNILVRDEPEIVTSLHPSPHSLRSSAKRQVNSSEVVLFIILIVFVSIMLVVP